MNDWKQFSRYAKNEFSKGDYVAALKLHKKALNTGTLNFSTNFSLDVEGAIAAVLVSHFNISDTYTALKQFEAACQQFETAFKFLHPLSDNKACNSEIELALIRAYSHLNFEWTKFINQHGKDLNAERTRWYLNAQKTFEHTRKPSYQVH